MVTKDFRGKYIYIYKYIQIQYVWPLGKLYVTYFTTRTHKMSIDHFHLLNAIFWTKDIIPLGLQAPSGKKKNMLGEIEESSQNRAQLQ